MLEKGLTLKKLRKLRSKIALLIINPHECFSYDPFICRFIPNWIFITNNGYRCGICGKKLRNVTHAYQHLLQEHGEELNMIVFQYVYNKWCWIGYIKCDMGDET